MIKGIKRYLGIEGVDVVLNIPESIDARKVDMIQGEILLSAKSDNEITEINISLVERYQRGRRKAKLINEYKLGQLTLTDNIQLAKHEHKVVRFQLPYRLKKSQIDTWSDKNIVFKGLASVAKLAKGAKSTFRIECEVKVKGTRLNPFVVKDIVIE